MALLDTGRSPEQPWGVILSIKDDNPERVLFIYPIKKTKLETLVEDSNEQLAIYRRRSDIKSWKEEVRFGVSLNALGTVIAPRDMTVKEIINKVDSLKFIGYWLPLQKDSQETLSIVFVLAGHCSKEAMDAHLSLARQICGTLVSLEKDTDYVKKQISLIKQIQDDYEQMLVQKTQDNCDHSELTRPPFFKSLRESTLLQSMEKIYNDIVYYGNNVLYIDRHIQLSLCMQSKSFLYCTLLPRTMAAVHEMMECVQSFHTLLFVEDLKVSADSNPLLASFVEHCTPERSFQEIRLKMKCTMSQLLRLAQNVVQWGKGVIIFPTLLHNSYTVGPPSSTSFTELARLYDELYPLASTPMANTPSSTSPVTSFLAEVLTFFSPAVTLEEFYVNANRYLPRAANAETFVFLLKTGLIIHLLVHIELVEPTQIWLQGKSIIPDLSTRIKTLISRCPHLQVKFKEYVLLVCSNLITIGISEVEIFQVLGYFICMVPHFLICDYVERIMHERKLTRANINRVIELFGPILLVFEVPAQLFNRHNK